LSISDISIIASGASAIDGILVDLFIILLAAKLGDELFKRIDQPAIIGEILAGILIGPSVLGLIDLNEAIDVFAELGVVLLLFWVGLETPLAQLRAVGKSAAAVGTLGVVIPLIGGFAMGKVLGYDFPTSVFLGAALVATSVGITSAVLIQIKALKSKPGRTILGAAVVDDILAMMLVAIAVGLASDDGVSFIGTTVILVVAVAFIAVFALGGTTLMRKRPEILGAPRFAKTPLIPAVLLCLGLAALSSEIGLAAIIGAFIAGLIVAETRQHHPVEREVEPLYSFFAPFFFATIGIQVDIGALANPTALALLGATIVVAVITKFLGAWIGARSLGKNESLTVAVGMVPRGEVGIVVAGLGQTSGVFDNRMFAVIVGMSIVTTLIVPYPLRKLAERQKRLDTAKESDL